MELVLGNNVNLRFSPSAGMLQKRRARCGWTRACPFPLLGRWQQGPAISKVTFLDQFCKRMFKEEGAHVLCGPE